jgi:DNA-binding response OmpR family regulator
MQILLFEDHDRLAMAIVKGLADFGFGVDIFASAADGLSAMKSVAYDGIVLDLGLPDRDGIDVLRELRGLDTRTPILILTARDGVDDRVAALDAGADDYVLKPCDMKELAARLRALLRRPGQSLGTMLTIGNVHLDVASREVAVNNSVVRFTPREIGALELLIRRQGQVVSRAALEDGLYGLSKDVSANAIEVLISRVRRRLEMAGASSSIHTLHGIGYLLKE